MPESWQQPPAGPDKEECSECSGEGGFDGDNICSHACDYCGGCFNHHPCERCRGTGEQLAECVECGGEVVLGACMDRATEECG